ncbi:MAG: bifunctional isocitrate dehydrogenase kinase/phosphatase [Rugosibacter sp.]|nr:bifunctional isocitrate dehydrogenase kinase/phosphatase [Rugosibacter sp.]
MKDGIQFYEGHVIETPVQICAEVNADNLNGEVWQQTNILELGLILRYWQPELMKTFFNLVCCQILRRT